MENSQFASILKPSSVLNMQKKMKQQGKTVDDREKFLMLWEESLRKKESELEQKSKDLKMLSRSIKTQSEELVKQKLEISEKIEKYSKILEQIVNHSVPNLHNISNLSINKVHTSKARSVRFNNSINECQTRVYNLLQTIRNTSSASSKTPQQSYLHQNEYEDILFSKRNHGNTSVDNQQDSQISHENQMRNIETSQRMFYQKVYEQMDKLKK
ncbi:hypothetical protein pb186bvf_013009 [Paramecium bursaria]